MGFSDDNEDRPAIDLRRPKRRRSLRAIFVALILLLLFGASALVSWYVDALWFG